MPMICLAKHNIPIPLSVYQPHFAPNIIYTHILQCPLTLRVYTTLCGHLLSIIQFSFSYVNSMRCLCQLLVNTNSYASSIALPISVLQYLLSNDIHLVASYAFALASTNVEPVAVIPRTRPPFVTTLPSDNLVPAWKQK